MDRIAVLIPCYNERKTIYNVIESAKRCLTDAKIYVYDNNSTDGSDEIAKSSGATVLYEYKQGKGNVVRKMFKDIDAMCYLMVDADDTYSLENANEMCDLILTKGYDMIIGDRLSSSYFIENKRQFHGFGNVMIKKLINSFFHTDVKDVMTGLRCFSFNFVKTFPALSNGFEIETEMTIHAIHYNMNIANVVIKYKDRPIDSPSKLNTISDGIKVILTFCRLYKNYKPYYFFSALSILLFFISTLFLLPVLYEFNKTGLVNKFPTLIVCGFVYMSSLIFYSIGLLLTTVIDKDKRDFEIKNKYFEMMKHSFFSL